MRSVNSDAGRSAAGFGFEHNDCSVVAMSHAAGIPYEKSHRMFHAAGRRRRCGTRMHSVESVLEVLKGEGWTVRNIPAPMMTVANYLYRLPKQGRFYLSCTTHAFSYVDGVVIDNLSRPKMRARMRRAFEIIPPTNYTPQQVQIAATPAKTFRTYYLPEVKPVVIEAPAPSVLQQSDISAMWERLKKLEEKL